MTSSENVQPLPEDWNKAIAVVAHPDDMEYGSAGAVARWTSQGKEVVYVMVTKGEAGIDTLTPEECVPLRMQEEINSANVVGVTTIEFLDHKDGVVEYGLPLRRDIARMIRKHRPDVLITSNSELTRRGGVLSMADHRNVGLAALDAARDAGNRWIFRDLLDEGYEPWNGVRMALLTGSGGTLHYVDVSGHIGKGVASLEEHKLYIDGLTDNRPNPDEMLRKRASEVGKLFGCEYAVTFGVLKI
jgi:LmbE family N-acetylglucosaminyl deacetylase